MDRFDMMEIIGCHFQKRFCRVEASVWYIGGENQLFMVERKQE